MPETRDAVNKVVALLKRCCRRLESRSPEPVDDLIEDTYAATCDWMYNTSKPICFMLQHESLGNAETYKPRLKLVPGEVDVARLTKIIDKVSEWVKEKEKTKQSPTGGSHF